MMKVMNDPTIEFYMRALAHGMLGWGSVTFEEAQKLLEKPNAKSIIQKMLECKSGFGGPEPRSIGIPIVSMSSASKMQQSLDHKKVKKSDDMEIVLDLIDIPLKPKLKLSLLHSNKNTMWVRIHCTSIGKSTTSINGFIIHRLAEDIYELYGERKLKLIDDFIHLLEVKYKAIIIFCSELFYFQYNPWLFVSNYKKFMWCYTQNQLVNNPKSYQEIREYRKLELSALLFLESKNLSTMPLKTHNPLVAFTGERPKIGLKKFTDQGPDKIYINEGSRAMQCMNKPSDFGTNSGFIELSTQILLYE